METTRQTTDASLVFDLLIRAENHKADTWLDIATPYLVATSDVLALQQDWDYRYSHGQDA